MKRNLFYIISTIIFGACGAGDCGTYYLSDGDLAFIPYTFEDSITLSFAGKNQIMVANTDHINIEHNHELVCDNAYEQSIVEIESNQTSITNSISEIVLDINAKEGLFNIYFIFDLNKADSSSTSIRFNYEPFYIDNKSIFNYTEMEINGNNYCNIFLMINEYSDSLYYSPIDGIIQMSCDEGKISLIE